MSARDSYNQSTARLRERFLQLAPRERWMVGLCGVVVFITVLYLGLWEPLAKAHQRRAEGLVSARSLAQKLEVAAAEVQRRSSAGSGANVNLNLSLLAAVDQSSRQSDLGKAPERIQPEGDKEVKVWFEDVSFDAVAKWLAVLQTRYGVSVQTLDVERQSGAGLVNVRLSLVRA